MPLAKKWYVVEAKAVDLIVKFVAHILVTCQSFTLIKNIWKAKQIAFGIIVCGLIPSVWPPLRLILVKIIIGVVNIKIRLITGQNIHIASLYVMLIVRIMTFHIFLKKSQDLIVHY